MHRAGAPRRRFGDARVGALVVSDDRVVGEGIESVKAGGDVTVHGEIEALRAAGQIAAII